MTNDLHQTIGSPPSSTPTNSILSEGMRLDNYLLKRRLGCGGMGEVWLADEMLRDTARQEKVLRQVVIKIVPRDVQNTTEEMERVSDSFDLIQGLNHTNICPLYGLKTDPVIGYYLVMKYIHGVLIQILSRLIANADWPISGKANTTVRLPIIPRRSVSSRI